MLQRQDIKDKINTFHLVDQEILAAVPFENPLAKQKDVSLKELVQYPFIYYSEKSGLRPAKSAWACSYFFILGR